MISSLNINNTVEAKAIHCEYCFDHIYSHIYGQEARSPTFDEAYCALFVGWYYMPQGEDERTLRGCMGTLEPCKLRNGLKHYIELSAFNDQRFNAINEDDLSDLITEVSLLSQFERINHCEEWEIGMHGLTISFFDPIIRTNRCATFLPYVSKEKKWTKKKTIHQLIRKSGYGFEIDEKLIKSLRITRFVCSVASMSHNEYLFRRSNHHENSNGHYYDNKLQSNS